MEARMSPNLTPETNPKHDLDSIGYEQVLYNSLKLIGADDYHNFMFRLQNFFFFFS
jgi:hypothetical protein